MRAIKFRGKRIDNGEWVYGSLLTWKDGVSKICVEDDFEQLIIHEVCPESIGKFTGLEDSKDIEIYEGDEIGVDYHGYKAGSIGKVNWNEDSLAWEVGKNKLLSDYDFRNLEIIN